MTEKDILKILKQHQKKCKFHDAVEKAVKPFIIIDPKCKAKDIFEYVKEEFERWGIR